MPSTLVSIAANDFTRPVETGGSENESSASFPGRATWQRKPTYPRKSWRPPLREGPKLGVDRSLVFEHFVGEIQIRADVLHVVVIIECLEQSQH